MTSTTIIVLLLSSSLFLCTNSDRHPGRTLVIKGGPLVGLPYHLVESLTRLRREAGSAPSQVEAEIMDDSKKVEMVITTDEITNISISTGQNTNESPPTDTGDEVIIHELLNDHPEPLNHQKRENAKIPKKTPKTVTRKGLVGSNGGEHMEAEGASGVLSNGSYQVKNATSIMDPKVFNINKTARKNNLK